MVTEPRPGAPGQIGDRLAAFTVCLPADPQGPVLIFTAADIAGSLVQRFAGAVVIDGDCSDLPESGSVALLVMDTRLG